MDHTILFKFHKHVVQSLIKYQIMFGETLDFQCRHQQWEHKMPDRKINFSVNLPLNLFRATVANVDIESPKSLHTFL